MRGWMLAIGMALGLAATPALAHKEKRTDPCGCHHQWGLRHCHPQKKSPKCEAPASDSAGEEQAGKKAPRKSPVVKPPTLEL